jgi:hypothetical protein
VVAIDIVVNAVRIVDISQIVVVRVIVTIGVAIISAVIIGVDAAVRLVIVGVIGRVIVLILVIVVERIWDSISVAKHKSHGYQWVSPSQNVHPVNHFCRHW